MKEADRMLFTNCFSLSRVGMVTGDRGIKDRDGCWEKKERDGFQIQMECLRDKTGPYQRRQNRHLFFHSSPLKCTHTQRHTHTRTHTHTQRLNYTITHIHTHTHTHTHTQTLNHTVTHTNT